MSAFTSASPTDPIPHPAPHHIIHEADTHYTAFGVPHFFKQHYENDLGLPREDGILDGTLRQIWLQPRLAVST